MNIIGKKQNILENSKNVGDLLEKRKKIMHSYLIYDSIYKVMNNSLLLRVQFMDSYFFEEELELLSQEVTNYIEALIPEREQEIKEIENYAKEHAVPIMELVGIEAMLQILKLIQPAKILEIGTAIGYSAIRMAKALPNVKIVTIERDKERYEKALYYINRTNTAKQIEVLFGDALELYEQVAEKGLFDAVFIDAAKGQYLRFFEMYEPLLSKQGIVITDNVLFKGLVAENQHIETKRIRNLVKKIREYNEWLMNHPDYETVILPIGDGIAISRKRGEQ
jgi:predicted O-methyltransferase YrrM